MSRNSRELTTVFCVLALVGTVFMQIPAAAFRGAVSEAEAPDEPFAAFVVLTPDEEQRAIRQAKSTLSTERADDLLLRPELILRDLPDDPREPVLGSAARTRARRPRSIPAEAVPFLPSQAAPAPARLPVAPEESPEPTFPREELLKID